MFFKDAPDTLGDIPLNAQQALDELFCSLSKIDSLVLEKIDVRNLFTVSKLLKDDEIMLRKTLKIVNKQLEDLGRELARMREMVCTDVLRSASRKISGMLMNNSVDKNICNCGTNEDENSLIACDGPHCEIEWFHRKCAGVADSHQRSWYCESCRKSAS